MKTIPAESFLSSLATTSHHTRSPEGVTFELTYGCNLRCVHCYNPTHRALPQELTTKEVFTILEQIANLGALNMFFTGGELFTRPDIFEIFERADRLGFLISILSNATRITPVVANALSRFRIRDLHLSIYGATAATYEQVTGITGSFAHFIEGLERLVTKNFSLVVRMPVLKENMEEVQEAQRLIEAYGCKFQYCVDINPRTDGDVSPLAHRLLPKEKVHLNEIMVGYSRLSLDATSCASSQDFISCACGRSRFAITPYGEMNLCTIFPIPKYDLRNGTVKEGWEVLKQTVDRARPNQQYECPSCEDRAYCKQGPVDSWLETGDMSPCLPHFKEFASLEKKASEYLDPRKPI